MLQMTNPILAASRNAKIKGAKIIQWTKMTKLSAAKIKGSTVTRWLEKGSIAYKTYLLSRSQKLSFLLAKMLLWQDYKYQYITTG